MTSARAVSCIAYDLPPGVDAICGTVQTWCQDAEIGHHAIFPKKGVVIRALRREIGPADHQTRVAEPKRLSISPAKSAQILKHTALPEERMPGLISGQG